jgi:hypothetical protein
MQNNMKICKKSQKNDYIVKLIKIDYKPWVLNQIKFLCLQYYC